MSNHTIRRHTLLFISMLLPLHAEDAALRDLLRDALYTEEVSGDAEKAAKQYEALIARNDEQRPFAANALYRLAEIRRQQNRKDEATTLYRRLLAAFPDAEPQAKLCHERLAGLGETPVVGDTTTSVLGEESNELSRLQQLALASPDLLRKPNIIIDAVKKGWARPVAFVLGQVNSPDCDALALETASEAGHLAIVKMVLARGLDPKSDSAGKAIFSAMKADNVEIVKTLFAAGVKQHFEPYDDQPTLLMFAAHNGDLAFARLLIDKGEDVNRTMSYASYQDKPLPINTKYIGGPLHDAINSNNPEIIELLLTHKADVNLTSAFSIFTPLSLAVSKNKPDLVKRLLTLGADPDTKSSPLSLAVEAGSVECVKLILEAKKKRNTPLDPAALYSAVKPSKILHSTLEIITLLLDSGADSDPKIPNYPSLLEYFAGYQLGEKGGNFLPVINLLLARGSTINPDWEKAGFTNCNQDFWTFLIRKFSYPKWATEQAIHIVDSGNNFQLSWPPAVPEGSDSAAPVLEKWLLEEEMCDLGELHKNFSGFALYRKTEQGIVEVSVIDLESDKAFPKLQWGDILELRGNNENHHFQWSDKAKVAMGKRVKATAKPADPQIQRTRGEPKIEPTPRPDMPPTTR
jgi:ankyrin repeat protein